MMNKARGSERTATFLSQFLRRFHVQEYTFRPNVYISSSSLFTSHVIAHIHVPRVLHHIWIFSKTILTTSFLLYAVNCAVALCVRVICIVGITVAALCSLDVCAFKLRSNACS